MLYHVFATDEGILLSCATSANRLGREKGRKYISKRLTFKFPRPRRSVNFNNTGYVIEFNRKGVVRSSVGKNLDIAVCCEVAIFGLNGVRENSTPCSTGFLQFPGECNGKLMSHHYSQVKRILER
jgi:hypothetical protein